MTQKWIQRLEEIKSHSRQKKGHMTNIYLTESDAETIVKEHEALYNKTNE